MREKTNNIYFDPDDGVHRDFSFVQDGVLHWSRSIGIDVADAEREQCRFRNENFS